MGWYIVFMLGSIGAIAMWALSGVATWPPPWYVIALVSVMGVVTLLTALVEWNEWEGRKPRPPRPSSNYRPRY